MLLVQLTGDPRWLDAPYRVGRAQGMGDNDTGGLPPDVQQEVRAAALEAILAWKEGAPIALPDPPEDLLVRMLTAAMGEPVPDEYGPFTAAQLSGDPQVAEPIDGADQLDAIIVGAGASGIAAAVYFEQAGIPFTILERNDQVGGVWHENRYPGAGVDTPNHLYSFSFMAHDWPMYFALQPDVHGYLSAVADAFDLHRHIRLRTEVLDAAWDGDGRRWRVRVRRPDGSTDELAARILISATGIFNPPRYPDIEGLDSFDGPVVHTARWRPDVELTGKRVAVIGNGASAMQLCPEIQHDVGALTIFQRSNHWAAPFDQFRREVPEPVRFLLREVPLYRAWYRVRLGWTFNDRVHAALQKDPEWQHADRSLNAMNEGHRQFFERYIEDELGDRTDLLPKVVPPYPPFGKRMLMDNGWYRMLRNPAVELVDSSITSIEGSTIHTADGAAHEADVLVVATGFDVLDFGTAFEVRGRSGTTLRDRWGDDGKAYLGMAVPDFPNFFVLYGPNTQPGHGGSLIFVIEMQLHYLLDLFARMVREGIDSVEVRDDVHERYNERVDAAHERMVWTHPGMQTYYRNSAGRVVVNYPWRNVDLFAATRRAELDDYVTTSDRATA
jgi:4-hydroxyacetophenone monooxygenase